MAWMLHFQFGNRVKSEWCDSNGDLLKNMEDFKCKFKDLNRSSFGNILFKKRRIIARLNGIQKKFCVCDTFFLIKLEK